MAFNGSGTFSRLYSWVTDKNNGLKIDSTRMDTDTNDIANGLSNCICKDGQTTITADIPLNSHKITGLANGASRTDAATLGQIIDGGELYAATSGTDTYTATLSPAITSYTTGMEVNLYFSNANTSTTPTININGVGDKTIVRTDASALVAGDINGEHTLRFDGTGFRLKNIARPVEGPSSATSGNIPTFNGTTGLLLQDSGVTPTVLMPTGAVLPYAGSSAPTGWLLLYGQAVSRTTYSALYAVIGTTYGSGDGSTTFNVPDMRGRVAAGVDSMGGSAASRITSANSGITGTTLGAYGGDERLHQHNHGVNETPHSHGYQAALNGSGTYLLNTGAAFNIAESLTTNSASTGITIQNTGAGGSQNVQPTMMLNYIIKT